MTFLWIVSVYILESKASQNSKARKKSIGAVTDTFYRRRMRRNIDLDCFALQRIISRQHS